MAGHEHMGEANQRGERHVQSAKNVCQKGHMKRHRMQREMTEPTSATPPQHRTDVYNMLESTATGHAHMEEAKQRGGRRHQKAHMQRVKDVCQKGHPKRHRMQRETAEPTSAAPPQPQTDVHNMQESTAAGSQQTGGAHHTKNHSTLQHGCTLAQALNCCKQPRELDKLRHAPHPHTRNKENSQRAPTPCRMHRHLPHNMAAKRAALAEQQSRLVIQQQQTDQQGARPSGRKASRRSNIRRTRKPRRTVSSPYMRMSTEHALQKLQQLRKKAAGAAHEQ